MSWSESVSETLPKPWPRGSAWRAWRAGARARGRAPWPARPRLARAVCVVVVVGGGGGGDNVAR